MKSYRSAGTVAPRGACGAGSMREAVDSRIVADARTHGAGAVLVHGVEDARGARAVGWIVTAVSMLAFVTLAGCGGKRSESSVTDSDVAVGAPADAFGIAQASADTGTESVVSRGVEPSAVPSDSLPPDIVASASETDVAAGGTVEIEARASADVTEVFLADGIGRRQSFAWDSTANLWRARYRVPLGVTADRLGVSVTARNGLDLRHRVWVFLKIEREPQATPPAKQPEAEEAQTPG